MNTLKRKLTAILLTLAMLLSLMPAFPQAAEAAEMKGEYVTLRYEEASWGVEGVGITVHVFIGEQEVQTIEVDRTKLATQNISLSINEGINYEFSDWEGIQLIHDGATIASDTMSSDLKTFSCQMTSNTHDLTINAYLRTPEEKPDTPSGIEESTSASPQFRAYDAEIMKLLYLHDVDIPLDASTEIDSVVLNFRVPFGYGESQNLSTPGEGLNGESDYCYYYISNSTGLAVPDNIKSVTINYDNNGQEGSVTIPAGDLQLVYGKDVATPYYSIESNDDTVRVVYFYNETDRNIGNAYYPYAVRFVENGRSLGADMPEDPTYDAEVSYNFVNWEYGNWDGTGKYFLSTTKVNDDLVVFAHKASLPTTGTEIQIMNPDSQLIKRIAELSGYDASQIILDDRFEVSVYDDEGTMTQPGYLDNGWRDYHGYYLVHNYDADNPGDPEITNDKLNFEKVDGIYVYFKVSGDDPGKIHTVKIPVGNDTGYLTKMMGDGVTLLKLYIIQPGEVIDDGEEEPDPQPPAEPTYDELKELIAVSVDCSTNGHDSKTTDLIANTDGQNNSYTLSVTGNTATVTVHNGPYVAWYDKQYKGTSHRLADNSAKDQVVNLTYDSGWKLADSEEASTTVHFDVVCDVATPEPGEGITGLTKELVSTADAAKAAVGTSEGYAFPENGVVVIPNGGTVKLLYSITVEGTAGTTFTVTDTGASLVAQADKDITENNGKFSGTIPDGDSITFYVSKEFGIGDVNGEGMLVNTATVSGKLEDPENPPTIDEKVPAEPELPTKDEVNALFNVMLDCSVVDSHDTTFENLIDESYEFGDIKYADGSYIVDMTVRIDDYLQNLNDTKPVHHDVDREEFKTVTLTYKNDGDQAGWTVVGEADPAELTTITFQVKCDGTGGYGINDFTKDIVNGETEKADAVAVIGEDKINEYVIPVEETDKITIPFNGEVTLLYKLTVTGNEKTDASFVVTDKGATFVKAVGDAQITVDPEKAGVFSGTVPAGGSVSFYVSKTFTGEDINDEGKLVNTALIAGANGDDTDPDIDEITETVPGGEAEPQGTITVTPC